MKYHVVYDTRDKTVFSVYPRQIDAIKDRAALWNAGKFEYDIKSVEVLLALAVAKAVNENLKVGRECIRAL